MPGVGGLDSIVANHGAKNIGDSRATFGVTEGNPLWEELRDIALSIGDSFLAVSYTHLHVQWGLYYGFPLSCHLFPVLILMPPIFKGELDGKFSDLPSLFGPTLQLNGDNSEKPSNARANKGTDDNTGGISHWDVMFLVGYVGGSLLTLLGFYVWGVKYQGRQFR